MKGEKNAVILADHPEPNHLNSICLYGRRNAPYCTMTTTAAAATAAWVERVAGERRRKSNCIEARDMYCGIDYTLTDTTNTEQQRISNIFRFAARLFALILLISGNRYFVYAGECE